MTLHRTSSTSSQSTIKPPNPSEQTPLLVPVSPVPTSATIEEAIQEGIDEEDVHLEDEDAPLDYGQILLLCFARMVDPISFFSIFPYVTYMIEWTGVDKADVGFYSGLIESLFSLTQMCVMIFWGKVCLSGFFTRMKDSMVWMSWLIMGGIGCRSVRQEALSYCLAFWRCDYDVLVWDE